ncbi:M20/M25/M40 family metallo-hydrolase [Flavobacterium sp. TP390]|uniref:M20/M25/M40 family metallo-hydrolase n=1 Tax=Flavobacterium profundi TaxID=1774945 RepID=A0A6I4IVJ7_9FLAO|nr:M20 family metallo-hydrolase [Flavobacterium profundi]MVO10979.1 M20/M25/M40 family metallo-hydrolase [Flavobacterium profundi]
MNTQELSNNTVTELYETALSLLKKLIITPSFSKSEDKTASILEDFFKLNGIPTQRSMNNVWAFNKLYDVTKPTILLNSHHDTVKPNSGYTLNPFEPIEKDGKLFGLGSNDAGGPLVSLICAFLYFYEKENLNYNLIITATAEEEISGVNGVESIYKKLGPIDFAIVGEPTEMNLAIAEKGLLVLDCEASGTSSHAAHPNTDNAILNAIQDIHWFTQYKFDKISPILGEVKMTPTIINSGSQHNVVPNSCHFTVDVRTNECYSNEEVYQLIQEKVKSKVTARSLRLNSSSIPLEHPYVKAGLALGRTYYGSPTSSDQAVIPCPSLKIGPGLSTRSHSSDEFIYLDEIKDAIQIHISILTQIL